MLSTVVRFSHQTQAQGNYTPSRMSSKLKFLTPEQLAFYKENGFIKLSGFFTEKEINEISQEYDKIFARKARENMDGLETAWIGEDMKKAAKNLDYTVKSVHNLHMHNALFTQLLTHQKILDAVEDIMGSPNILLHHTKAHNKPPEKGAPYLMHQDYPYFPFKEHSMHAVFLHVDDSTPENGGLCVYPGSHKLGPLKERRFKDDFGDNYMWVDPEKYPIAGATPVSAKRGEIVIFSYLLIHGSYLNTSTRSRRMLLTQVRSADDEPVKDVHHSPCQNLVLRGENLHFKSDKTTRFVDSGANQ